MTEKYLEQYLNAQHRMAGLYIHIVEYPEAKERKVSEDNLSEPVWSNCMEQNAGVSTVCCSLCMKKGGERKNTVSAHLRRRNTATKETGDLQGERENGGKKAGMRRGSRDEEGVPLSKPSCITPTLGATLHTLPRSHNQNMGGPKKGSTNTDK